MDSRWGSCNRARVGLFPVARWPLHFSFVYGAFSGDFATNELALLDSAPICKESGHNIRSRQSNRPFVARIVVPAWYVHPFLLVRIQGRISLDEGQPISTVAGTRTRENSQAGKSRPRAKLYLRPSELHPLPSSGYGAKMVPTEQDQGLREDEGPDAGIQSAAEASGRAGFG